MNVSLPLYSESNILHSSSGVRRVSVLGGSGAQKTLHLVYNRSGYLGARTGVCPPQARSTEATRVAYL